MLIFLESYFWYGLIPVILIFLLYRREDKGFLLIKYFPTYWHYFVSVVTAVYVGLEHNTNYQFYCNPVLWSQLGLLVGFIWVLLFPVIKKQNVITYMFSGWSVFCMTYLIYFGSIDLLEFIVVNLLFTFPLLILRMFMNNKYQVRILDFLNYTFWVTTFPFWITFWFFQKVFNKSSFKGLVGIIFPSVLIGFCVVVGVRTNEITQTQEIKSSFDYYVAELYYGTHWKYHTRICLYDGWRPPYHDPIVVLSRLFLAETDEFRSMESTFLWVADLNKVNYHQFFPDKPLTFNCKCGRNQTVY